MESVREPVKVALPLASVVTAVRTGAPSSVEVAVNSKVWPSAGVPPLTVLSTSMVKLPERSHFLSATPKEVAALGEVTPSALHFSSASAYSLLEWLPLNMKYVLPV